MVDAFFRVVEHYVPQQMHRVSNDFLRLEVFFRYVILVCFLVFFLKTVCLAVQYMVLGRDHDVFFSFLDHDYKLTPWTMGQFIFCICFVSCWVFVQFLLLVMRFLYWLFSTPVGTLRTKR